MKRSIPILISCLLVVGCASNKEIIQIPILFNEKRVELTKEYLQQRYGLEQETPEITPRMIVLHWTAIPSLKKSFEAFNRPTLPNWRPDIESVSGLNVSAHFLVDQDGTIYQLMPENIMARHVIGLNHCAIGIENVGGTDAMPLTKKQLAANIYLVEQLASQYPIEYVIGHQEYTLFENHPLWLQVDDGYRTKKTDPGMDFTNRVRQATKKFNFKPVPSK